MVNKTSYISDNELLGRVLDGDASQLLRNQTVSRLADDKFRECFITALHAMVCYKMK